MNRPTVDIVVPCYNVGYIVEQCIRSILAQRYDKPIHMYIINDGSTDNTAEVLQSFAGHPGVTVLHHESNKGLAAARNTGIKAGQGEIICFLDSDMVVREDWVTHHVQVLADEHVVGVVGESSLPQDESPSTLDKYLYDRRRGARRFGEDTPIHFPYFLFNNTAIKRSVFDIIDLFDEKITTYGGEDTELAIRIWESYPNSLRYSSKAVSVHFNKRDMDGFCRLMYQYGKINLPSLIAQFPEHSNYLGAPWIHSFRGYMFFNPFIRWVVRKIHQFQASFWLTRYLVIDSVIRGARASTIEK